MLIYYITMFVAIVLEAFPISSSTHYRCFVAGYSALTGYALDDQTVFLIDHLSHSSIALTVIIFFWKDWKIFLLHFRRLFFIFVKIMYLGLITQLLTVVSYLVLEQIGTQWFPVWLGCAITAIALYALGSVSDTAHARSKAWNSKSAIFLGIAQSCALLPGVSRFAITYVAARYSGICSRRAFQISFLIEVPLSLAGPWYALYKIGYVNELIYLLNWNMLIVMIIAGVCLYGLLSMIKHLVKQEKLWIFSYYMALLSLGMLAISIGKG
jgi:undecaprenyl-diphosphatase